MKINKLIVPLVILLSCVSLIYAEEPPGDWKGYVTIDGIKAIDGTPVSAVINNSFVANTSVGAVEPNTGYYLLHIPSPAVPQIVSFYVLGKDTGISFPWTPGVHTYDNQPYLNLSINKSQNSASCLYDVVCSSGHCCSGTCLPSCTVETGNVVEGSHNNGGGGGGGGSMPQCNDKKDNDNDGTCDFLGCTISGIKLPKDTDCASYSDNTEGPNVTIDNHALNITELYKEQNQTNQTIEQPIQLPIQQPVEPVEGDGTPSNNSFFQKPVGDNGTKKVEPKFDVVGNTNFLDNFRSNDVVQRAKVGVPILLLLCIILFL